MKKILLIITICISFLTTQNLSAQFSMSQGSKKLATIMTLIEKMYVDNVDDNKLAEDAIESLLQKLDPHSAYLSAETVADMNEPLEGNFDGIGIAFNMMNDTLYVIETIAGGPSEKVGILPGDRITMVDDTIISGVKMSTKDIMKRLKGPKRTKVKVKINRRGQDTPLDFLITRAKIPIYSLDAAYMLDENTGYIRLSRFGATTIAEFQEALEKLRSEGMNNLILDLEGNGGGYLSAASDLSNAFIGKDKLVVYMEGAHQSKVSDITQKNGSFETGKLVILVDEGSASASEIVSGAVQDWDRGIIVGRRTFGKGLVQRQFPLPDESMIRLTVSRYYTPTGRSIQRPYESGNQEAYNRDLIDRYNRGEMMNADSIHFPDSLKFETLINHRTVYGGGGIMPDYFVPLDTTAYSDYSAKLTAYGIIYRAALNEVDLNRKSLLKKYPTDKEFKKEYQVSDELLKGMIQLAKDDKIEFNEEQYERSKNILKKRIKALVARDLYDNAAYFKIINEESDIFKKGLEIINNDEEYNKLLIGTKQTK